MTPDEKVEKALVCPPGWGRSGSPQAPTHQRISVKKENPFKVSVGPRFTCLQRVTEVFLLLASCFPPVRTPFAPSHGLVELLILLFLHLS